MAGLKDYLNKRKQSKLFKQWVQKARLPAEEMLPELRNNQGKTSSQSLNMEAIDVDTPYSPKRGMISFPIKYLLLMILVIVVLFGALSVVTTLLLAGSCSRLPNPGLINGIYRLAQ
ncbi:hypothetical protein ACFLU8_05295 [Chloroflexota bacterium]